MTACKSTRESNKQSAYDNVSKYCMEKVIGSSSCFEDDL